MSHMQNTNQDACSRCVAARRDFLTRSAVGGLAGVAAVGLPAVVGVSTMFQPLISQTGHDVETDTADTGAPAGGGTEVRLASLAALPEDGTPQRAVVYLDRIDGWNRTPNQPVGSVWLRRTGESTVQAFHLSCPHAGCGIQYNTSEKLFYCPCHGATFDLEGVRLESPSESPRDLDTLEVRIDGDHVYVAFQDFGAGTSEKAPI